MKKLFWIILFLVLIAVIYGTQDKEEKKVNEKIKIENNSTTTNNNNNNILKYCKMKNGSTYSTYKKCAYEEEITKKEYDQLNSISTTTNTKKSTTTNTKKSSSVEWYDENKYAICYGEMTKAHKKRGYHDSNRVQSIKVKETVCKAFAKGDINDYEGKQ